MGGCIRFTVTQLNGPTLYALGKVGRCQIFNKRSYLLLEWLLSCAYVGHVLGVCIMQLSMYSLFRLYTVLNVHMFATDGKKSKHIFGNEMDSFDLYRIYYCFDHNEIYLFLQ